MNTEDDKPKLMPDIRVQKALISTTTKLIGEFHSDYFLISHASPNMSDRDIQLRYNESPASRSSLIVAFRTQGYDPVAGLVIPNYEHVGMIVSALMSVLYGKRFDSHGMVECSGFFYTPNLNVYNSLNNHRLPFNSHNKRDEFSIDLNLKNFITIERIVLDSCINEKLRVAVYSASKFYQQAICNAEEDPETAYLHLITAGEIISGYDQSVVNDSLDEELVTIIGEIKDKLENGLEKAEYIKSRVNVKRKFVNALCSLINDDFFTTQSNEAFSKFKKENFENSIKAAYDLRSWYVHSGQSFGNWVKPSYDNGDIQNGSPIVPDKQFAKILKNAPRICGLERTIRYCILSLISKHGFKIENMT